MNGTRLMKGLLQGVEDEAGMRRPAHPPVDNAAGEGVDRLMGKEQSANRLDPEYPPEFVDEGDHRFNGRSSSAMLLAFP